MENFETFEEMTLDQFWDFLTSEEIATQNELQLVTCINGYNFESLFNVFNARTALNSLEQYKMEVELWTYQK